MNNKKNILIIILILLVIGIVILMTNNSKIIDKKTVKDIVQERMENRDTFILYSTASVSSCYLCTDADIYLEYYQKMYNLDVVEINTNEISKKEYNELIEYLITDNLLVNPAFLLIKEGELKYVIPEAYFESELKKALIEYEFIPENIYEKEIGDDDLTFEQVYSSTDKQIILVYNYIQTTYDIKKMLVELSNEYKFTYNLLYHGRDGYSEDYLRVRQTFKKKNIPIMLIVQDSQVIDYSIELNTKEEIIGFLKKNQIIV